MSFAHPEAYALIQALQDDGVIGDFRAPNILRFGVSPAVLRFVDVFDAVECLEATVRSGRHRAACYQTTKEVT